MVQEKEMKAPELFSLTEIKGTEATKKKGQDYHESHD